MAQPLARIWWIALAGAAVAVVALALLLPKHPDSISSAAGDGGECNVPATVNLQPMPEGDNPPVILWAEGAARLFLNDEPAFSSPDEPKRLRVGEYSVRAEAPHVASTVVRISVGPFDPVLLHAHVDERAGLTLVRLGGSCKSCDFPESAVSLQPERPSAPSGRLLTDAAESLRRNDWYSAAAKLRQVPVADRARPLFAQLAAIVYSDTLQPEAAQHVLSAGAKGSEMASLVAAFTRLNVAERERRQSVVLARWNKTTERFGALILRFGREAPVPVGAAAKRLEKLSSAFEAASQKHDAVAEQEVLRAAEEALGGLAGDIRSVRPTDCPFQADVLATLVR